MYDVDAAIEHLPDALEKDLQSLRNDARKNVLRSYMAVALAFADACDAIGWDDGYRRCMACRSQARSLRDGEYDD